MNRPKPYEPMRLVCLKNNESSRIGNFEDVFKGFEFDPNYYLVCDGQELESIKDYKELYELLKSTGMTNLPKIRDRFVEDPANEFGHIGGIINANKHTNKR